MKTPTSGPNDALQRVAEQIDESSSSGSCGSDRNRSVSHISAASTLPREMPAIAPIDRADDDRDQHRREADRERDAAAVEHAREDVLAEVVGAERMLQRRRLAGAR